ncbi:hypothetical protein ACLHDG_14285 [Sulfurovum sp. CS9]|uniref:hypothetical protein n=1 Tax=Sulfurovum sp. CS9 TaxID=3391146 RepID=UPI0039EBBA23
MYLQSSLNCYKILQALYIEDDAVIREKDASSSIRKAEQNIHVGIKYHCWI